MAGKCIAVGALVVLVLAGCTGIQTFPTAARPGDTVLLPLGWGAALGRESVTVTVLPAAGSPVTLGPGDPRIRALVRLYPDPASRLIVGSETGQGLGVNAAAYGALLQQRITGADREWWLQVLCLDLPPGLPAGPATLVVAGPAGEQRVSLEILEGSGLPAGLASFGLDLSRAAGALATLERAPHTTMRFQGPRAPHAIQATLARSPGVGAPWLVNPRGDLKNMAWSDDGTTIRVLLTATGGRPLPDLVDFTILVAGELAGLRIDGVRAYDRSGSVIPGITASLE
ncbi:MAG: hypothetical protein WC713_04955 [Candidatus Methylomirabilota bacterium]